MEGTFWVYSDVYLLTSMSCASEDFISIMIEEALAGLTSRFALSKSSYGLTSFYDCSLVTLITLLLDLVLKSSSDAFASSFC